MLTLFYLQSIIIAISHVRDERGNPFQQVQRFLVDLLTYNDNATNPVCSGLPLVHDLLVTDNPI